MKLKKIQLRNFQKHKKQEIVFSPRITTLCGATDSGKSAILRALRWLCLNDLSGNSFVREGSKGAKVQLKVKAGKRELTITRCRGKRNSYHLEDKDYFSFVKGVPEDIKQLLRVNAVNFQAQHDKHFWFGETAGELARQLNAVVDLSIIDNVLSQAARKTAEAKSQCTVAVQRKQELEQQLAESQKQIPRVEEFARMKKRHGACKKLESQFIALSEIVSQIEAQKEIQKRFQEEGRQLAPVLVLWRKWQQKEKHFSELSDLVIAMESCSKNEPPDILPLERAFYKYQKSGRLFKKLLLCVELYQAEEVSLREAKKQEAFHSRNYHESIQGKTCPLCQQPLNP